MLLRTMLVLLAVAAATTAAAGDRRRRRRCWRLSQLITKNPTNPTQPHPRPPQHIENRTHCDTLLGPGLNISCSVPRIISLPILVSLGARSRWRQ